MKKMLIMLVLAIGMVTVAAPLSANDQQCASIAGTFAVYGDTDSGSGPVSTLGIAQITESRIDTLSWSGYAGTEVASNTHGTYEVTPRCRINYVLKQGGREYGFAHGVIINKDKFILMTNANGITDMLTFERTNQNWVAPIDTNP